MASKLVSGRVKASRLVHASAETHATELAKNINALLEPHLARGEKMPDVALLAKLLARRITVATEHMVQSDHVHEQELSDDAAPRNTRDESAQKLRVVLIEVRDATTLVHGSEGLAALGLTEPAPVDPSAMATHAERVSQALRDRTIKLPSKRTRVSMDREVFADEIDAHRTVLVKALANVARETREAESTLKAKSEAIARNDEVFTRTASALSALFRLGELDDLAQRVRPSTRRPGQIDESTEPTPAPTPAE